MLITCLLDDVEILEGEVTSKSHLGVREFIILNINITICYFEKTRTLNVDKCWLRDIKITQQKIKKSSPPSLRTSFSSSSLPLTCGRHAL